jgi:predicted helicase
VTKMLLPYIDRGEFQELFLRELGWSRPQSGALSIDVDGDSYDAQEVARYKGIVVWVCPTVPARSVQTRIDDELGKIALERLVIFADAAHQEWRWLKKKRQTANLKPKLLTHEHIVGVDNDRLNFRLNAIAIGFEEQEPSLVEMLSRMHEAFDVEEIRNGMVLARIMAQHARTLRDSIREYLPTQLESYGDLADLYNLMKKQLVRDLDTDQFADMYAQTLVYGLFVARYRSHTLEGFSRAEARGLLPPTNPFLQVLFDHVAGDGFDPRLRKTVDELCESFDLSDVRSVVSAHLAAYDANVNDARDPIVHFYEDFLNEYDPEQKQTRGVYYTPRPIVRFIVEQVHEILREHFGLPQGLGDASMRAVEIDPTTGLVASATSTSSQAELVHNVQILDPAVGTATFLNEAILYIQEVLGLDGEAWADYVYRDLIPRLSGFELMMAPYTIAHMKLAMTLADSGIEISERLGVYLTNTLEPASSLTHDLFTYQLAEAFTQEAEAASSVKSERPVMVVLGNPPYSGISSNETKFANDIVERYKVEPGGGKLQEKKHWLNDDYVKFLGYAEQTVARTGEGVVAMITNNGFIDNLTFRGMRWQLAKTFDEIRILDLHGNSKKKEKAPDGGKDENVFDITQGVSIIFAIKNPTPRSSEFASVFHGDLFGTRASKFEALRAGDLTFEEVELDPKYFFFVNKNQAGKSDYSAGVGIDELFNANVSGIVTARDSVVIDVDREALRSRIERFAGGEESDDEIRSWLFPGKQDKKYLAGDSRGWQLSAARKLIASNDHDALIQPIVYRPFDKRFIYYSPQMVDWGRESMMKHLVGHENFGLVVPKQIAPGESPGALVIDTIAGHKTYSAYNINYVFPLYVYDASGSEHPNFDARVLQTFTSQLSFEPSALDVFDYVYGALWTPSYGQSNRHHMEDGYPRISMPASDDDFLRISAAGAALRSAHLMKGELTAEAGDSFPVRGSNLVSEARWSEGRVWVNQTQYFTGVDEAVFKFKVGGYQPVAKWLSDRKGSVLSDSDIEYVAVMIEAIQITARIGLELDGE